MPCAEKAAETPRASEFSYGYGGDFYYGGTQCLCIPQSGDHMPPMPLMPQCRNGCLTPNDYAILPAGKGAYRLEPKLEFTE